MKSIWFRRILLLAVVVLLVAAIFPAISYYRYFNSHVSTDDAYVDGSVGLISSRITGTVVKLFVEDNWRVKAGDTLLELDPSDYQVQVNAAEAQLERARQTVDQLYAQVEAARSGLRSPNPSSARPVSTTTGRASSRRRAWCPVNTTTRRTPRSAWRSPPKDWRITN